MKFRLRSSLGVAATIVGIGLVWGGSPARGAPPCPSGAGIGKADSCHINVNCVDGLPGWDSLLLDPPPNVHMIHHPCCDVQMLSGGESPFRMGDDFIALAGWRCGGSERGSSGSPLFATATRTVLGAFSGLLVEPPGATDGLSCAPDSTIHLFGAYNGFGHQFLGALPSVPGHDPA